MIQRKQTLFLLLALVAGILCLCMPLGLLLPAGMGVPSTVYNLCVVSGEQTVSYGKVAALFFILLAVCAISLYAIFLYKNRKRQAMFCSVGMLLVLVWYALYAYLAYTSYGVEGYSFQPQWTAALPFVCDIFIWLARRGVIADEKLVRSMDRIR